MNATSSPNPQPLLGVAGMVKCYRRPGVSGWLGSDGHLAVDGVDFTIRPGEVVGLIGESGSGKTTLARAALGLIPFEKGEVELLGLRGARIRSARYLHRRRRAQLLVQNPDASLNPRLPVVALLQESAEIHRPGVDPREAARGIARQVSIEHRLRALPHQLSGGEKRRVGIARLLLADPLLTVADEPTAGLDASLKAEIADLLLGSRSPERGYLIISHDLPLVVYCCDRVAVMYAGRIVEEAAVAGLGRDRHHPYTRALLTAAGLISRQGSPPIPAPRGRLRGRAGPGNREPAWGAGCAYAALCPWAFDRCERSAPALREVGSDAAPPLGAIRPPAPHRIACYALDVKEEE